MTQKILLPVPVTLDNDRAKALLENIRRRISDGKVNAADELLGEAMAALDTFFSHLSEPISQGGAIRPERDPANHNETMNNFYSDIVAGFNTARALGNSIVASFNLTASLVGHLDGRIRKLATKSQDLQSVTGVFVEEVVVVSDNFSDNSKVDLSKVEEADRCDVTPGMGSTLKKVEAVTATDGAKVTLQSSHPVYEGKLYALEGEAVPEGGKFHFGKTADTAGMPDPASIPRTTWAVGDDLPNRIPLPMRQQTANGLAGTAGTKGQNIEKGASEEERAKVRENILDGSPDSYWQAEYVVDIPKQNASEMSYQDMINLVQGSGVDSIDLEVVLTLRLVEPKTINMLVLDPLNAGDGAWIEVTDISTSLDGNTWKQIQGFSDHNFENILTDEANEELTDYEVGMTLAPNRYEYVGKGLWTFPAVEARYIKVALLQRAPIPAPYDVKVFEMQGTTVTTHAGGGNSPTYTSTSVETRTEKLSYIDTLRLLHGVDSESRLTGGAGTTGTEKQLGFMEGNAFDVIQDFFDPGRLLHKPAPRSTKREFSGWTIKDSWNETMWDKARYMVGIRDLRAFSYLFDGVSECVTKPFLSPKPISKIVLLTDEAVPNEFNDEPVVQPWILYWVSLDDGGTWIPICPTAAGVINNLQGSTIPVTINVNSGIPEEEWEPTQAYVDVEDPRSVRLKWRILRPASRSDMTPVLKSYKLKLFVENGL